MMTIDGKIRGEKLQWNIIREKAKISFIIKKITHYEYHAAEEILLRNRSKMKEHVKFTYLLYGETFEKKNDSRAWR